MNGLFSIIVPCYNASKYLNDVFLSIKNQTYQDIEAIFVDDGSTDETGKMLDDFAKSYSKAKVIHKKNGGQCSARNLGIANAKGDYIMFMDNDDLISPYSVSSAIEIFTKYNADIISFKFKVVSCNSTYFKKFKRGSDKTVVLNNPDGIYLKYISNVKGRSVWAKAYKHDFFKTIPGYPKIFDEKCFYGEDVLATVKVFKFCSIAVWSDEIIYYYRQRKTSTSQKGIKEKEILSTFFCEPILKSLDPKVFKESVKYVPSLICFLAMDVIRRLPSSDYNNSKVIKEVYHRYRDNLKYLPRLKRLAWPYRFGTLFTLPVMYLMIRKKLKG